MEIVRPAHHLQRERINIQVRRFHFRVVRCDFFEGALPKITGILHDVRLVAHAHFFQTTRARVLERVLDDPLDTFAGMNLFLDGHLVGSSLLEHPAYSGVCPLRVFTKHGEVDLIELHILQGTQLFVKKPDGANVRVQVQTESDAEQNIGGVAHIGNTGIAHRAHKNRIELVAKHFKSAFGQRHSIAQVFLGAPIEFDELQFLAEHLVHSPQHLQGLASDVDTDPIAGNHCNSFHIRFRT